MASTNTTSARTVAIPAHVRSFKLSLWADSRESYESLVTENFAEEHSSQIDERWHRWATWRVDENDYNVHDPARYGTDPLSGEERISELLTMMSRVVQARDMDTAEKVRELSRLAARMREIAPVPDPTDADLHIIADAFAGTGGE